MPGSCLGHCDERMRVKKSLVMALKNSLSSDVTPPAVLPALVPSLVEISKSAGLASACMHSQKLDAKLCEPFSYYDSACVPKWPQKQSQRNFLGKHTPRPL